MRRANRMIPFRDQNNRPVRGGHHLIQAAVICIDTLQHIALRRVYAVIIGFFQKAFMRQIICIMLMRRIRGPMPGRGDDLYHKQAVRGFCFRQDITDKTRICAAAALFQRHLIRGDETGGVIISKARGAADRYLAGRSSSDRPAGPARHIKRIWRGPVKHRRPPLYQAERRLTGAELCRA